MATATKRRPKKSKRQPDRLAEFAEGPATEPETLGRDGPEDTITAAIDEVLDQAAAADAVPALDSPERLAEWDAETRRRLSACAAEVVNPRTLEAVHAMLAECVRLRAIRAAAAASGQRRNCTPANARGRTWSHRRSASANLTDC